MPDSRDMVVVSGVRAAIGDDGGTIKEMPPLDRAAAVIAEAVNRAGVPGWRDGLVTMCMGGEQGIATISESPT